MIQQITILSLTCFIHSASAWAFSRLVVRISRSSFSLSIKASNIFLSCSYIETLNASYMVTVILLQSTNFSNYMMCEYIYNRTPIHELISLKKIHDANNSWSMYFKPASSKKLMYFSKTLILPVPLGFVGIFSSFEPCVVSEAFVWRKTNHMYTWNINYIALINFMKVVIVVVHVQFKFSFEQLQWMKGFL